MAINNKVLNEDFELDIDENGVCVIPNGIEIIDYIENDKIKKLVIPEGVKIVGRDCIYCPNLEQIELPSSVEIIGRIDSRKLTLDNIKFGNKTFIFTKNDSLGNKKTTAQYVNSIVQDLINQIEEALNTNDYSSIYSFMKLYSSFCYLIDQNSQEKLSYLIGTLLSKQIDGIEIGQNLMVECFKNNQLFNPFILQYFHFKECENLNLDWIPLIIVDYHGNLAHSDERQITLGYKSLLSKNTSMFRNQHLDGVSMNDSILINLNTMFVLSHELQHSRQRANGERKESVFDFLDGIDFKVSKAIPYKNDHDIRPEEIRADLGAYDSLIEHIVGLLPDTLVENYRKIIERIKLGRIEQAHQIDANGNIGILDYRQRFFDKSLNDTTISSESRSSLLALQEEYIQLLNVANLNGIDLYEGSLGYYISKKNSEDIQEL